MAESIFARVSRLLSATVEDAVDRMEQAGGDAVMREAIREADRAIDQVKVEHQSTMARRLQAARQQKMLSERVEELTAKAKFALGEGREEAAGAPAPLVPHVVPEGIGGGDAGGLHHGVG